MFIFLDTETTGTGPKDRLCQIAFKPEDGEPVCELFNPGIPISIDAMTIHHITNRMVADKPPFKDSEAFRQLRKLTSGPQNYVVAHNARFDIGILANEGIRAVNFICTLKLARYLDAKGTIPKYSLQYLRYYLDLDVEATAHDALGDVLVLEALFKRLRTRFQENGVADIAAEMMRVSTRPILLRRMNFGKHKGVQFSEIPRDYLEWLSSIDLDEDLAHTVKHHLGRIPSGTD